MGVSRTTVFFAAVLLQLGVQRRSKNKKRSKQRKALVCSFFCRNLSLSDAYVILIPAYTTGSLSSVVGHAFVAA